MAGVRVITGVRLFTGLRLLAAVWLLGLGALAVWSLVPLAWGWTPVLITGGSMAPRVRPGDVVLIDHGAARQRVAVGQVVLCHSAVPGGQDVTHRVKQVLADGSVITQGDANDFRDSTPIPPDRLVGVARLVVPAAGRVTMAFRHGSPDRPGTAGDRLWAGLTALALLVLAPARTRHAGVRTNGAQTRLTESLRSR